MGPCAPTQHRTQNGQNIHGKRKRSLTGSPQRSPVPSLGFASRASLGAPTAPDHLGIPRGAWCRVNTAGSFGARWNMIPGALVRAATRISVTEGALPTSCTLRAGRRTTARARAVTRQSPEDHNMGEQGEQNSVRVMRRCAPRGAEQVYQGPRSRAMACRNRERAGNATIIIFLAGGRGCSKKSRLLLIKCTRTVITVLLRINVSGSTFSSTTNVNLV
jgi:hypothetical protein